MADRRFAKKIRAAPRAHGTRPPRVDVRAGKAEPGSAWNLAEAGSVRPFVTRLGYSNRGRGRGVERRRCRRPVWDPEADAAWRSSATVDACSPGSPVRPAMAPILESRFAPCSNPRTGIHSNEKTPIGPTSHSSLSTNADAWLVSVTNMRFVQSDLLLLFANPKRRPVLPPHPPVLVGPLIRKTQDAQSIGELGSTGWSVRGLFLET